uniref:Protein AMBP n=1 Tax=Accipiter nisus TaxID=211598 RepID=A0A8B9NF13_9AVES
MLGLSGTPKPPAMMLWGLLSLLLFTVASGTSIRDQHEDIQVQENFEMYGKWYDIAIGTTCKWMKNYKEKFSMGTLVLGPGPSANQISTASTRLRQGDCTHVSGEYQKTSTPGKYTYYNPKWDVSIQSYVLRTNYEEYAVILLKKESSFGPSTTLKLYGRNPELRKDLIDGFQQLALEMGIPADSIFILVCASFPVQRARRAVLPPEEGSATGPLPPYIGNKEDSCRLSQDSGPCSGMVSRFFYNSSSMACETFLYGGCLGNGAFAEQPPVPTAACRLPVIQGPCQKPVTRWAFDAARGKCITFSYGGCKGNGNQFYSEKECKEYCGAPPLAGTPTLPTPCLHRTGLGWGSQGSSLHHLLSCSGLGLGLPGMGTGLSWIWDVSVLGLDGSRMGLSWVWDTPGMSLSWV